MRNAARELMLESSFVSDVISVRKFSFWVAVRGNVHLGGLDAINKQFLKLLSACILEMFEYEAHTM